MSAERIIFGDSKAIKITSDMRKGLNSYNQKIIEINSLKNEINELEKTRNSKQGKIEDLNIQMASEDKKVAKEATKKIKALDKEITKIDNNIKHINDKLEKVASQNHAQLIGTTLKSISALDKPEETPVIPLEQPMIAVEPIVTEEIISQEPTEVDDLAKELDFDLEENISEDKVENKKEETYNFLSPEQLDKMWAELNSPIENKKEETPIEPIEEVIEAPQEKQTIEAPEVIEEPTEETIEEKVEESQEQVEDIKEEEIDMEPIEVPEVDTEQPIIEDTKEKVVPENEEESEETIENELEKPNIFGENSKFNEIAKQEVSPDPLLNEESNNDLIPYSDYNDYVFKFGQNHYGKEALTPTEISDLSNVEGFLNEEKFTLRRSGQYNDVVKENTELRDKIIKLDTDFKKQIEDLTNEHTSNLNELDKLIDDANDKINSYKARISQLEKLNKSLTDTINEQDKTIENLNSQNKGLQDTIVNLNEKISDLENIKEKHENKINDYENKFKEVLTIVKEVKGSEK